MDDFISPIPRPLLNPLIRLLAIRLGWQKTPSKPLVIPQAGEEAIVPSTFVARSGCVWLV